MALSRDVNILGSINNLALNLKYKSSGGRGSNFNNKASKGVKSSWLGANNNEFLNYVGRLPSWYIYL